MHYILYSSLDSDKFYIVLTRESKVMMKAVPLHSTLNCLLKPILSYSLLSFTKRMLLHQSEDMQSYILSLCHILCVWYIDDTT
jgi:hypothetical protein